MKIEDMKFKDRSELLDQFFNTYSSYEEIEKNKENKENLSDLLDKTKHLYNNHEISEYLYIDNKCIKKCTDYRNYNKHTEVLKNTIINLVISNQAKNYIKDNYCKCLYPDSIKKLKCELEEIGEKDDAKIIDDFVKIKECDPKTIIPVLKDVSQFILPFKYILNCLGYRFEKSDNNIIYKDKEKIAENLKGSKFTFYSEELRESFFNDFEKILTDLKITKSYIKYCYKINPKFLDTKDSFLHMISFLRKPDQSCYKLRTFCWAHNIQLQEIERVIIVNNYIHGVIAGNNIVWSKYADYIPIEFRI